MRLRDMANVVPIEVVRDCEFRDLGLLSGDSPDILACLYDPAFAYECERNGNLAGLVAGRDAAASAPPHLGLAVADAPRDRFFEVHRYLGSNTDFYGADFASEISPDVRVGPTAYVAPRRVRIGPGCLLEPGAIVLEGSVLEQDVIIRAGAVIGAEGFHPTPYAGKLANLPHYGSVVIQRGVEIQSNSVICRSVFQNATAIGEETKIGTMVYVAHAVRIGARCRLASSARISGSSKIGDGVFIGPNAVVSNRIVVGDGARISLGSVVVSNVPAGQTVTGNFAVEHKRFLSFFRGLLK